MRLDPAAPRAAGPRELDRLAELWAALARHHGDGPRFRLRPGAEDALRARLRGARADPDTGLWVAGPEGGIEGFCLARVLRRPDVFDETERGEIEALYVRPEARRNRVGSALVRAACAWLADRGLARVELQVEVRNAEGRAFWRSLGFASAMDVLERPL